MTCARPVTAEEYKQGYMICGCGKFAHVFRSAILRQLPEGYNGEMCPDCKLWMVAVDKLPENPPVTA
jgi:hypothetical protein